MSLVFEASCKNQICPSSISQQDSYELEMAAERESQEVASHSHVRMTENKGEADDRQQQADNQPACATPVAVNLLDRPAVYELQTQKQDASCDEMMLAIHDNYC